MFLLAAQEVVNVDTVVPDESTPLSHQYLDPKPISVIGFVKSYQRYQRVILYLHYISHAIYYPAH